MLQSNRVRLGFVLVVVFALMFIDPSAGHAGNGVVDVGASVFRGDVFVNNGGALVNPTTANPGNTALFNVAGAPLKLTWGQWQRASALSEAMTIGDASQPKTEVGIILHGLVPGGVYSIYYATFGPDTINPACPAVEHYLPLVKLRASGLPDPASFVADANGNAQYLARVDGNLLSAVKVVYNVIYHYDGHTYYPLPNRGEYLTQGSSCRSSYGVDDGRQLLIAQKE